MARHAYMRALGLAMRHRLVVSVIALLVIFSSVPCIARSSRSSFRPTWTKPNLK
jgi:hypothetical protein